MTTNTFVTALYTRILHKNQLRLISPIQSCTQLFYKRPQWSSELNCPRVHLALALLISSSPIGKLNPKTSKSQNKGLVVPWEKNFTQLPAEKWLEKFPVIKTQIRGALTAWCRLLQELYQTLMTSQGFQPGREMFNFSKSPWLDHRSASYHITKELKEAVASFRWNAPLALPSWIFRA